MDTRAWCRWSGKKKSAGMLVWSANVHNFTDCRCRSCSQIVTLDALGDVAVWSLTGGGTITTNANGQFIPPPLACTMTLPPLCAREGESATPPALLQLQSMFHFKNPSSSVRLRVLLLPPPPLPPHLPPPPPPPPHPLPLFPPPPSPHCHTLTGSILHFIPSLLHRHGFPPLHPCWALRRCNYKAKFCSQPISCICRGSRAAYSNNT